MSSIRQAKSVLRKEMKQKLKGLPEQEKKTQSAIVLRKVLASEVYKNSHRVSVFLPMSDEVNTLPILQSMLDAGKQCFIPHYKGPDMIMVNLDSWESYEKLPMNSWGIKQPGDFDETQDAVHSGGLDLILMPGLAFTKDGARLGRGKGYYDQYLHKCANSGKLPKTLALIFKEQLVEHIPTLEHDMFVDSVMYPLQQEIDEFKP